MSAAAVPRWPLGSRQQLAHALLLVLLQMALFGLMFAEVAPRVLGSTFNPAEPSAGLFGLLAATCLLQSGVVLGLGLLRTGRVSLRALGWRTTEVRADVGWGLLGLLAAAAVVLGLSAALGSPPRETLDGWLHQPPGARLVGLCIGLVWAFNEETLFRGYLQGGLVARLGPALGVGATALVFALYHGQLAPLPLLGKLLLGLLFGALAWRRRSLVPSAVTHLLMWVVMGFS